MPRLIPSAGLALKLADRPLDLQHLILNYAERFDLARETLGPERQDRV